MLEDDPLDPAELPQDEEISQAFDLFTLALSPTATPLTDVRPPDPPEDEYRFGPGIIPVDQPAGTTKDSDVLDNAATKAAEDAVSGDAAPGGRSHRGN